MDLVLIVLKGSVENHGNRGCNIVNTDVKN